MFGWSTRNAAPDHSTSDVRRYTHDTRLPIDHDALQSPARHDGNHGNAIAGDRFFYHLAELENTRRKDSF
jgi:hypothetical protein